MRIMKTITLILCLSTLPLIPLFSDSDLAVTVRSVKGKVEAQAPGQGWVPLKSGDRLSTGATISTGFNAEAVLILGNDTILVAKPLTRLTIRKLMEREESVESELFLDLGHIRAEVHSSDEVKHDFRVHSAYATASVRGTVLDARIGGDGGTLQVTAWDGSARVEHHESGRVTSIGTEKGAGNTGTAKRTGNSAAPAPEEMRLPPEGPEAVTAAPVMAGAEAASLVTSAMVADAASQLRWDTRPVPPAELSLGGGTSAAFSDPIGEADDGLAGSPAPDITWSNVDIEIDWPL